MMIAYVMGAGRSGTTLIDILIGNLPGGMSLGEVRKFFDLDGQAPGREAGPVLQFWTEIFKEIEFDMSHGYKNSWCSTLEYHTFLPITFVIRLLNIRLPKYASAWRKFWSTVSNSAPEKSIFVDSSKYPGRALLLEKYVRDISLVYIERPRRQVVASFQKKGIEQPPKSAFGANAYWLLNKVACDITYRLWRKPKIKVNFLQLQQNPQHIVYTLAAFLKVDGQGLCEKLENGMPLETGMIFEGNRIRLKDEVKVGAPNE